jgi:hypothetical protein
MIENYLKYCKYYKREISSVPQRERFFFVKNTRRCCVFAENIVILQRKTL